MDFKQKMPNKVINFAPPASVDDQQIKLQRDTAVVFAKVTICGNYDGNPANGTFRFTRVWQNTEGNRWEVIAAHSSVITV